MVDSRCGLHCTGCAWKESHGCGGCVETGGHPFHGECPVAQCCQGKGLAHCGECGSIPCGQLYQYAYTDPEHGDRPPGRRVEVCRAWAAEAGEHRWENVLLTSGGWWKTHEGGVRPGIRDRFLSMLAKPPEEAWVLFITAAVVDDEARPAMRKCRDELLSVGILPEHIVPNALEHAIPAGEAMRFDVLYVVGGDTRHLLRRMKATRFDEVAKAMVYASKVYVGASAGSLVATPNIGDPKAAETAGLCLAHAYLSVHCPEGMRPRQDLPLPHIPLRDDQALAVSWRGYTLIDG